VLSRHTGFARPYDQNPYVRYDASGQQPFLYSGRLDPRLPPLERVETITAGGHTVVVPFDILRRHRATAVKVGGQRAVIFFDPDVTSALDASEMRASRAVGTAAAFDPHLDGRTLSFAAATPGVAVDAQTGSHWDITGHAISGPFRGARLRSLHDLQAFWFAVAAFLPNARLIEP